MWETWEQDLSGRMPSHQLQPWKNQKYVLTSFLVLACICIEGGPTFMGMSVKHLSLLVLLLQNSILVLMMRYSRVAVDPDQPMYLASTAVFVAEIIKLATCVAVLIYNNGSLFRAMDIIRKEVVGQPGEIAKMLVPSGLYALQNNLLYIALSNLDAATFQVTYQMKILSTAILSVFMLKKRLTKQKWLSLFLLMVGVTLVQLQNVGLSRGPMVLDSLEDEEGEFLDLDVPIGDSVAESANQMMDDLGDDELTQNPVIGLLAVLTSCISSGFAGCYFEKIIKGTEADMWVRNLQLGLSGALFSFLAMFYDRQRILEGGMFQGYTTITWIVVINQALGGLLVAIVVKYADNILKGFATSLSIIISGLISVYFFDFEPSFHFQLGALVVIFATYMYGRPDVPIPRFIRPRKKRQSIPPPQKFPSS
ncbi:MAG: nucleotide-sugar transporter [Benniella sp.]|nr:MAG: nucleotide-sugar transporter [Benniella sp.]